VIRNVSSIVAVVVALSVGGAGIALGSPQRPDYPATAAKGKNHSLKVDYKSSFETVLGEGEGPGGATTEISIESKLKGRPFGSKKAFLDETDLFTLNQPVQSPRTDFSGTHHVTFTARFNPGGKFDGAKFRGFYDYAVDANGIPSTPMVGEITGGTRIFKGAKGSFTVLDFVVISPDPVRHAARWEGSIRY
jgi:hypothetical protein